jgi:hypothetical protein
MAVSFKKGVLIQEPKPLQIKGAFVHKTTEADFDSPTGKAVQGVIEAIDNLVAENAKLQALEAMTEDEALVSEYIHLYKELEKHDVSQITKRMDEIKKQLQLIANEEVADESPAIFTSPAGEIEFSKRSEVKTFNEPADLLEKLVETHGLEAVKSVVKIQIGPLGKLLSDNEMAKFYTLKPGSRSLKEVRPKE